MAVVQPDLENAIIPVMKRKNATKIEIPEKLIRFLLFFVALYDNWTLFRGGVFSSRNSSIFILSIESTSLIFGVLWTDFISMASSVVFLSGVGVILDLGILLMILVW